KSLRAWQQGEWFRIGLDEHIGGVAAPSVVGWAINEFVLGANPAVFLYLAGPAFANILYHIGNEQQRHWAALAADRNWGATMVLTEPDAGSDVGAGRTKAIQQPDGTWHIDGVKRFITNGDTDDLFENILHVVLARPEGAGPGTKGLSLFLVPKYLFDPQSGQPGERNGVFVTGLEHKMGLKVSATTELTFGQHGVPATGWLVGDTHRGIAQMFKLIEYARMMVGTKAISTLSTGYLNALDYAKTRVQGADLTQMTNKKAPRVTIIHHPDVRRALLTQKAYAEGLRALYLYTAAHQDPIVASHVSGADAELADRVNNLLLPIVKGVGSERAYQCLTESLQTFGGSGFLQDYPIEQYIRDAKIDSLYEGTTAIQAQDFFFRKIARDQGVALQHVVAQIQKFLNSDTGRPELAEGRCVLASALYDLQAMVTALTGFLVDSAQNARELYRLGLESVPFLLAVGDLLIGWLLLHQAEIALNALDAEPDSKDRTFYSGKVAGANFFVKNVLPRLAAERRIVEAVDLSVMELREEAF
ncbi:acyl-CoA dehydrogenase, partial [Mycobacterium sp.]|uniref:acyl-CoA dehydrogenase n=1 Tax=Mycobacterium sp. TaxID=1785 RepID=UPI002C5F2C67